MPRSPLHNLEKEAELKAQEYKQRLIEEGLKKLAAEESAEIFPPQGDDLPAHPNAPHDADDKRRGSHG